MGPVGFPDDPDVVCETKTKVKETSKKDLDLGNLNNGVNLY